MSCDGSWQKRGHSSLNGVVTVISSDSGKCLDYRVMTKTCKACESWESRKGAEEYELFLSNHECNINYEGSSGSMEAAGVVECFMSSEDDRNFDTSIRYIDDGDSKSYSDVVANDPYHGKEVKRLECVGHIQKHLGARLTTLKTTHTSTLVDGKPMGGKERFTYKMINKLQNYFGITITQSETVYELKNAIGAVLFHCSEASNLDTRHQMCSHSSVSWCKFQADKIDNTSLYKNNPGLPSVVRDAIKPIFMGLSDDNLLKKYLHGQTQNNHESLYGVIWKRCPKDVFIG